MYCSVRLYKILFELKKMKFSVLCFHFQADDSLTRYHKDTTTAIQQINTEV